MSDDLSNHDFGCEICWPSSAEAAWEAKRKLDKTLIDESHYMVVIETCATCSQYFINVFADATDWAGGEDPMYWTILPLTHEEVHDLGSNEPPSEAALKRLGRARRSLNRDFPKGVEQARAYWATGISTTRM